MYSKWVNDIDAVFCDVPTDNIHIYEVKAHFLYGQPKIDVYHINGFMGEIAFKDWETPDHGVKTETKNYKCKSISGQLNDRIGMLVQSMAQHFTSKTLSVGSWVDKALAEADCPSGGRRLEPHLVARHRRHHLVQRRELHVQGSQGGCSVREHQLGPDPDQHHGGQGGPAEHQESGRPCTRRVG